MLGIFLDTVFVAWKGPNRLWVEYLATADRARRPQDLKLKFRDEYHDGDLSVQLRMLILLSREPNTPFNRESLQQAQEMARDVRAIRNHLAHHLPITDDWAYNAIVRCQTLLKWIEAPDVSRQHSDAKLSKAARKYAKYLQMRWNPAVESMERWKPAPSRLSEWDVHELEWIFNKFYSDLSSGEGPESLLFDPDY